MNLNSKGQMFAGYRLLIGAILAGLILIIIVGVIQNIDQIKFQIGETQLYEGLNSAIQIPDGATQIVKEDLSFQPNYAFSAEAFSLQSKIPAECIAISSSDSSAFNVSSNSQIIEITTSIITDVYYICEQNACPATPNQPLCEISFGKPLVDS